MSSLATPDALRVAILTPTGRDAALTAAVFSAAQLEYVICPNLECLGEIIAEGAGGALGSRPPQGRVPGHAGPRAAQSLGADPQLAAHSAAFQRQRSGHRSSLRNDGAASRTSCPLGGRLDGSFTDHARQGGAAA